tara:strand:+ start:28160 stop:28453 length:294 start_codon:yes stop_codon:yes gene_type:complete
MSKNQKNKDWIDDLLDGVDDPIVSETNGFAYISFVESLIYGSINTGDEKQKLIDSLETMRKSEMDALCMWLKDNQVYNDCRDQFKQMCRNGVFNNKK